MPPAARSMSWHTVRSETCLAPPGARDPSGRNRLLDNPRSGPAASGKRGRASCRRASAGRPGDAQPDPHCVTPGRPAPEGRRCQRNDSAGRTAPRLRRGQVAKGADPEAARLAPDRTLEKRVNINLLRPEHSRAGTRPYSSFRRPAPNRI